MNNKKEIRPYIFYNDEIINEKFKKYDYFLKKINKSSNITDCIIELFNSDNKFKIINELRTFLFLILDDKQYVDKLKEQNFKGKKYPLSLLYYILCSDDYTIGKKLIDNGCLVNEIFEHIENDILQFNIIYKAINEQIGIGKKHSYLYFPLISVFSILKIKQKYNWTTDSFNSGFLKNKVDFIKFLIKNGCEFTENDFKLLKKIIEKYSFVSTYFIDFLNINDTNILLKI